MHRLIGLLCLLSLAGSSLANELPAAEGAILFTISGNITHTNSENGAEFDLHMLESLGATSFVTKNPWVESETTYTGVRINDLLNAVGAKSSSFRAAALDNYWYDITDADFDKYPIILAYMRDGEYMTARNLGPLWIMYPFDDFPELITEENKASCVWHLNSMVVM